jgi:hypothetical protein
MYSKDKHPGLVVRCNLQINDLNGGMKSNFHEFNVLNHFVRRFYLFNLRDGLLERVGRRVR